LQLIKTSLEQFDLLARRGSHRLDGLELFTADEIQSLTELELTLPSRV